MASSVKFRNNIPLLINFIGKDSSSTLKAGAFLEAQVVKKVASGSIPPPLLPATIKAKKSSGVLVDKGQLLQQVTTRQDVAGKGKTIDVGVFGSRAYIASIHEFGHMESGIPERSFLRSTLNENKEELKKIIGDATKDNIKQTTLK